MQLEIPVKPHVKTFLEHPINLGPGPSDIRKDHWLGEILLAVLSFHPLDRNDLGVDYMPAQISKYSTIVINPTFKINYQLVTDGHLARIGMGLEAWFKMAMVFYVQGRMTLLLSEQGAVRKFYEEYGISSEDYDLDAAFKVAQRARAHL
ncbi:hypothetical protein [Arundinibacter roseus]|uniref:Uncharacterized protein n=1 Tax=Arundinibacter roseus TaxID=2070510 RepID=A0A4R4KK82_9BACT|nr:hypothetical protein [Arundinibacter roseus]TDB67099.1 hypothetical protein EZE20_08270 [Arundinibacter roseus]